MMRSLYSGVAGLRVHQTKMDVIGNNISNVNTVGFKGSNVNFSDIYYQTTKSASGPNAITGTTGKNAMQVGLGSTVASITANIAGAGGAQRTDNPFDVMINGDSFFVVNSGGVNYFTKAGAFTVDVAGTLATPAGASVMGWQVNKDGTEIEKDTVSPLKIMSPENLYADPEATTQAHFLGNIDQKDKVLTSSSGMVATLNFYDNLGNLYTARYSVKPTEGNDAKKNQYSVSLKDIIDKNGDSIFAKKTADDKYVASAITGVNFGGAAYTVKIDETEGVTLETSSAAPVMTFNASNGHFVSVDKSGSTTDSGTTIPTGNNTLDLSIAAGDTSPFKNINIDFSSMTMFETGGSSTMEGKKGNVDASGRGAGKKVGDMIGLSIDDAGKIWGSYDNGDKRLLGQIAVASFPNPSGLEAIGNSMFAATKNSGDFDGVGKDPTAGGDSLSSGMLEMSNVDLSNEFTTMITTQRGFQANSRIITTSDAMLEELINLKR